MTRLKEEQTTQSKLQEEETASLKEKAALLKDQLHLLVRDRYALIWYSAYQETEKDFLKCRIPDYCISINSGEELFQLLRGGGVQERGLKRIVSLDSSSELAIRLFVIFLFKMGESRTPVIAGKGTLLLAATISLLYCGSRWKWFLQERFGCTTDEKERRRKRSVKAGLVGLVGNTPLVKIKSLSDATGCERKLFNSLLYLDIWYEPPLLSKSAAESGLLSEAKAEPHLQRLKSLISETQERDHDTAAWNMKLKAKLYSLDAQASLGSEQSGSFGQLPAEIIPKSLHCLSMKLGSIYRTHQSIREKVARKLQLSRFGANSFFHLCISRIMLRAVSPVMKSTDNGCSEAR
ncbi:hypothetical protein R1sor_026009 [Riccia sorocarpa]|uniref:Uncharacterized protein n=1 Tax=Riccia sorocarpa TaxID=122646 RepID=A0ABD3GDV7_9MARC